MLTLKNENWLATREAGYYFRDYYRVIVASTIIKMLRDLFHATENAFDNIEGCILTRHFMEYICLFSIFTFRFG